MLYRGLSVQTVQYAPCAIEPTSRSKCQTIYENNIKHKANPTSWTLKALNYFAILKWKVCCDCGCFQFYLLQGSAAGECDGICPCQGTGHAVHGLQPERVSWPFKNKKRTSNIFRGIHLFYLQGTLSNGWSWTRTLPDLEIDWAFSPMNLKVDAASKDALWGPDHAEKDLHIPHPGGAVVRWSQKAESYWIPPREAETNAHESGLLLVP